jgi:hypothetical protein
MRLRRDRSATHAQIDPACKGCRGQRPALTFHIDRLAGLRAESAEENLPAARLVLTPPLVMEAPRPKAVPPRVVVDCGAAEAARATLRLPPPLVITRPRQKAVPPTVVVFCPAKPKAPEAILRLLPPLVMATPWRPAMPPSVVAD